MRVPSVGQPQASNQVHPVQSPFPQSSFVGLGSLLSRRRSEEAGTTLLHEPPQVEGSDPSSNIFPTVEGLVPQGSVAAGTTWSYQQPAHSYMGRHGSLPHPLTSSTNPQFASAMPLSTTTRQRRSGSLNDIEAQRGFFCLFHFLFVADENYSARDNAGGFSVEREYAGIY